MSFKRSVLLTAGVALAASLISNAASPKTPVSRVITEAEAPRPAASSQSTVSPKLGFSKKPAPASTDPVPDAPNTVLTAASLAVTDTVFSYCGQADQTNAAFYQALITGSTNGHNAAETAALRSAPEYLNQQATLSALLGNVPQPSGAVACQAILSTNHRPLGTTNPIRTPGMGSAHQ